MRWRATVALAILKILHINGASKCGEVTITEWGGEKPRTVEYLPRPVGLVIIQHTVTPECSTDQQCADRVKSIQYYHTKQLHYSNIASNFLVGGNGKVYQGRGWLHVGAHSCGYNRRSIGITFIGEFRSKEPTAAALQAVKNFLKCGVDKKYLTNDYHLVGHRQVKATESPGASLYNLITDWPHWTHEAADKQPGCRTLSAVHTNQEYNKI